jgi:large subunit ribosomal protein L22
MAWTATHKFARISPQKTRLVVNMIRGKRVQEALNLLKFTRKRAAVYIYQVLKSATANADEQEADVSRLFVKECRIDPGPTMHRFQPKDRGRAFPIKKRSSHIIVTVEQAGA